MVDHARCHGRSARLHSVALLLAISMRLAFECDTDAETTGVVLLVGADLLLGSAIGVRVAESIVGRVAP